MDLLEVRMKEEDGRPTRHHYLWSTAVVQR